MEERTESLGLDNLPTLLESDKIVIKTVNSRACLYVYAILHLLDFIMSVLPTFCPPSVEMGTCG